MKPEKQFKEGELFYFLTLFKLEGHQTWRAHLSGKKDEFDESWNSQQQEVKPKITERNNLVIDRVSGLFKIRL